MSDSGREIVFNDVNAARLHAAALRSREEPLSFLEERDIFGTVADSAVFRDRFVEALTSLRDVGTRATLSAYVG